jgi:hypothetical protein
MYSHTATAVIVSRPKVLASGEGYFVAITSDIPVKLPARLEVILRKKTLGGGAEELYLWNIFPL